ncbi:MAG: hypothetical protein ABIP51_11790 [Bacteroidia bacterium]
MLKVGDKVKLKNIEQARSQAQLPNNVNFDKSKNIELVLIEKEEVSFVKGKGFVSLWRCEGGLIQKTYDDLPVVVINEISISEILIPETGIEKC